MKQTQPAQPTTKWFVVIAKDPKTGKFETASEPLSRADAITALQKQWAKNRPAYLHPRK